MLTVQTQIRRHKMWRLIRISTVCKQTVLIEFEKKYHPITLKTEMDWSDKGWKLIRFKLINVLSRLTFISLRKSLLHCHVVMCIQSIYWGTASQCLELVCDLWIYNVYPIRRSRGGPGVLDQVFIPWKIAELLSQHSMVGHHWHASVTPFKWRFADGPMIARL